MLGLLEEPPQAATATAHLSPTAAARIRDLVMAQFYAAADHGAVPSLRDRLRSCVLSREQRQQRPRLDLGFRQLRGRVRSDGC